VGTGAASGGQPGAASGCGMLWRAGGIISLTKTRVSAAAAARRCPSPAQCTGGQQPPPHAVDAKGSCQLEQQLTGCLLRQMAVPRPPTRGFHHGNDPVMPPIIGGERGASGANRDLRQENLSQKMRRLPIAFLTGL